MKHRNKDDGTRVLVDRLWPRGLTKEKAKVDLWLKDIAPSTELRKSFGHDPKKWRRFRGRYQTELKHHGDQLKLIKSNAKEGTVTLIYGARDREHNEAVVLKQFLETSDQSGKQERRKRHPTQKTFLRFSIPDLFSSSCFPIFLIHSLPAQGRKWRSLVWRAILPNELGTN